MSNPFAVETARTEDLAPALRLIFRHVAAEDREGRVAHALEMIARRSIDPAGIMVIRENGVVLGAVVCAPVAGAGGVLWPPQAVPHPRQQPIEDQLLAEALDWLRRRGVKLAQTLLAAQETSLGAVLLRNGFDHVTDLWYLRHELAHPPAATPDRLFCQTYAECDQRLFHETLLNSYEDTQDCPEVNGHRTMEEIIVGHRNQGVHDPDLWWLAWADSEPAGVVLSTEMPDWGGWDLVYLGVVKRWRGHGVGRELTHRTLAAAHRAGQKQLTLSVDVRNQAAWNLYRSAGFEPYDRRAVFLWFSRDQAQGAGIRSQEPGIDS